jgi:hypothetical protein
MFANLIEAGLASTIASSFKATDSRTFKLSCACFAASLVLACLAGTLLAFTLFFVY